jgi:hypothetical protein
MVPGLTLRESQFTEARRQELLARVAAEQRVRRFAAPMHRSPRLSGIIGRAMAAVNPLRRVEGLTAKTPASSPQILPTPK